MGGTKEQIKEWKRLGLCSSCGKNKTSDGYLTCQECRDNAKVNREYSRKHGWCVKCHRNKTAPNRRYCDECLEWRRERYQTQKDKQKYIDVIKLKNKKRNEERKANNLCVRCGKPSFEGRTLCYEHLIETRNRARRERALFKEYKGE